jgi:hypothetical protein
MHSTAVKQNSPEIDPTFFCHGSTQPPSRNSVYSSAESHSRQTRKPCAQNQEPRTETNVQNPEGSGHAKTCIDQLEKENQQLNNLLSNQIPTSEDVSQGYNSIKCDTTGKIKCLSSPDNIMSKERDVKRLLSGDDCQIIKTDTDRKTVIDTRAGCVSSTKYLGIQNKKENPSHDYNLCSVPDVVKDIP